MITWLLPIAAAAELETVQVGAIERTFWVQVPQSAKRAGKRPAVVLFHGAGPDTSANKGQKFGKATQMSRAAAEFGAVSVFPNGVSGAWYPPEWAPDTVDDVAFGKAIFDVLVQKYGVDPTRVAAAGFSSGGHQAMQWACTDPRVAGIAVVGASVSELQQQKGCASGTPLPTLFALGRKDPVNPYLGGAVNGARTKDNSGVNVPSASQSAAFFANRNQCANRTKSKSLRAPDSRVIGDRDKFSSCGKGRVELYSLPMGHVWPLAGKRNAYLGASAYVARFFQKRVWSKRLR